MKLNQSALKKLHLSQATEGRRVRRCGLGVGGIILALRVEGLKGLRVEGLKGLRVEGLKGLRV